MKSRLLILPLLIITTCLRGQGLVNGTYCQGCCGCITVNYLNLGSNNKFSINHSFRIKNKWDGEAFGFGSYQINQDTVTLIFAEIPKPTIEVSKENAMDSIIIHFKVNSSLENDSLIGTNILFSRNVSDSFIFSHRQGSVKMKYKGFESIQFQFSGFLDMKYVITEPGKYNIDVALSPTAQKIYKRGEIRKLRIRKNNSELRDIYDNKIFFTQKNCKC